MAGWHALAGDVNGDERTDLVWNNDASSAVDVWIMNDGVIQETIGLNQNMPVGCSSSKSPSLLS